MSGTTRVPSLLALIAASAAALAVDLISYALGIHPTISIGAAGTMVYVYCSLRDMEL